MKEFLVKWGILTPEKVTASIDPDEYLQDAVTQVQREELVNDFLEIALTRYCGRCDEFFKRAHSLNMHKKYKHPIQKGG